MTCASAHALAAAVLALACRRRAVNHDTVVAAGRAGPVRAWPAPTSSRTRRSSPQLGRRRPRTIWEGRPVNGQPRYIVAGARRAGRRRALRRAGARPPRALPAARRRQRASTWRSSATRRRAPTPTPTTPCRDRRTACRACSPRAPRRGSSASPNTRPAFGICVDPPVPGPAAPAAPRLLARPGRQPDQPGLPRRHGRPRLPRLHGRRRSSTATRASRASASRTSATSCSLLANFDKFVEMELHAPRLAQGDGRRAPRPPRLRAGHRPRAHRRLRREPGRAGDGEPPRRAAHDEPGPRLPGHGRRSAHQGGRGPRALRRADLPARLLRRPGRRRGRGASLPRDLRHGGHDRADRDDGAGAEPLPGLALPGRAGGRGARVPARIPRRRDDVDGDLPATPTCGVAEDPRRDGAPHPPRVASTGGPADALRVDVHVPFAARPGRDDGRRVLQRAARPLLHRRQRRGDRADPRRRRRARLVAHGPGLQGLSAHARRTPSRPWRPSAASTARPPGGPNSHFFTASPAECDVREARRGLVLRGHRLLRPAACRPTGAAPTGHLQVLRAYNQGFPRNDSNHRYTTSDSTWREMARHGWALEGAVMCARP